MMPYMRNTEAYRELPFSEETPTGEFYRFMSVTEIAASNRESGSVHQRCRTIGVLHSTNGQYSLKNIDRHDTNIRCEVNVSFEYLSQPPQSAIVPYPAQIFGSLTFVDSTPVVYASVLQPLSHDLAQSMNNLMSLICRTHLATSQPPWQNDVSEISENKG